MQYELCRHIKTNGLQCKAAALTGGLWCYFHHHSSINATAPSATPKPPAATSFPGQHIELTPLEDRESVQVALSPSSSTPWPTGKLETKRATALLYGLQLASNNSRGLHTEPYAANVVRTIGPSAEGLDLAEPGAVFGHTTTSTTSPTKTKMTRRTKKTRTTSSPAAPAVSYEERCERCA